MAMQGLAFLHLDTCKRMHAFGCVNKVSGVFCFNFVRFVPILCVSKALCLLLISYKT
jgi:hypothetical protein